MMMFVDLSIENDPGFTLISAGKGKIKGFRSSDDAEDFSNEQKNKRKMEQSNGRKQTDFFIDIS